MAEFEYILLLLLIVLGVTPLARRWDIPLPVLQVVAGMMLAALPWKGPAFDPDVVFLIFVPPLLYFAALVSSRRDLTRFRRPIAFLALGCGTATIIAVACVVHALVPGMSWTAAAVLGAIRAEGIDGHCYNLVGDVRPNARTYVAALAETLRRPLRYHPQWPTWLWLEDIGKWAIKRVTGRAAPMPSRRDFLSRGMEATFDCTDAKRDLGWQPEADADRFFAGAGRVYAP